MSHFGRRLDRIKVLAYRLFGIAGQIVVFVLIAGLGGFGSSLYLTSQPSFLTAERSGPWVAWTAAGQPDADPYTRVHFASLGSLPINANAVRIFETATDGEGRRLQGSCDYMIEGKPLPATWWSLALYTDRGRLIANPAERYAFNAADTATAPDGTFTIVVARDARPGNWLPAGGAARLTLLLSLHGLSDPALAAEPGSPAAQLALPAVRRLGCH